MVEQIFVSCVGCIGTVLIATIIGRMNVLYQRMSSWSNAMHEDLQCKRVAMEELGLPRSLRMRMEALHEYIALSHDERSMRVLEQSLNQPLLVDLKLSLFADVVFATPFFESANAAVTLEVMLALEFTLWQ